MEEELVESADLSIVLAQSGDVTAQWTIGLIFVGIPLLGIWKCISIMRRSTTSNLCVLALIAALAAIASIGIVGISASNMEPGSPLSLVLMMLCSLAFFGFAIAAVVIAIIGLVSLKKRADTINQGKAQAIWALVISGVAFLYLISATVYAAAVGPAMAKAKAPPVTSGGTHIDENLNFKFEKPSSPWIENSPELINPDASLIFRSFSPPAMTIVIAERLGVDMGITSEQLAQIAKGNLKAISGTITTGDVTTRTIKGIEFKVFPTEIKNFSGTNQTFHYEHWVTYLNGFGYQIITHSSKGAADVSQMAESMVQRFDILDPELVAGSAYDTIEPETRPNLGFSVDLSENGWTEWPTMDNEFPEAQFGALHSQSLATGILSMDLGELDADIDAIATGFIAATFGRYHPDATRNRKEILQGKASGISLESYEKNIEGDFAYRFRVLKNGSRVWFLSAWTWANNPDYHETLENALDAYDIFPVAEDAEVQESPQRVTAGMASVFNQIGLEHYRRQGYEAGLPFYERAFELMPDDSQFFENIVDALKNTGKTDEGLELLDKYRDQFTDNLNLDTFRGWFLHQKGNLEEARASYAKAFEKGHENESDLLEFVNVLIDMEKREESIEVLKNYRARHPNASTDVEVWQSEVLFQLEREDEAIELVRELYKKSPSSLAILGTLIETQLDAGHYSEALVDIEKAMEGGVTNASMHYYLGRAKLGQDSLREAKSAFEKAQSLAPNDALIQNYLDHTSAMLGKGNIASIKNEIEAVPVPSAVAELAARLEADHADKLDKDYGLSCLQKTRGISYQDGKPHKFTNSTRIKITNARGLDEYSTLQFAFDPLTEGIFINEVIVTDEEGNVVATGNVDDYYIVDLNTDDLATTEKVIYIPVPGLEIGRTLSYTVTREDFASADRFRYTEHSMSRYEPCVGVISYAVGDTEHLKSKKTGDVKTLEIEEGIAFYSELPDRLHLEPDQLWTTEFAPWVCLGDKRNTWEEESKEYLEKLTPLLNEDSEQISNLAKSIFKESQSIDEKVHAVADYVQNALNYQGIEFGERGQVPNKVADILKNKYGDCKDHSLLIVQLLKAVDIPAHLALASTSNPIREDFPSLDQFNHMIVYVPGMKAGSPFIDGTTDYFPSGALAPESLINEKVLVLDPESPAIKTVELVSDKPSRIVINRVITIDTETNGPAVVEETSQLFGYPTSWFRGYFKSQRKSDYNTALTGMLAGHGAPVFQSIEVKGLDDNRAPLEIQSKYEVPRTFVSDERGASIAPPAVWERYFTRMHFSGERHNPFEIPTSFEIESHNKFVIPAGYKINKDLLNRHQFDLSSSFADWTSKTKLNNSDVEISVRFARKPGRFEPAEYEKYIKASNAGLDRLVKELALNEE